MRREVSRGDVRGMLKFFCGHGWHACRPNAAFWELLEFLDRDFSWTLDNDTPKILHTHAAHGTVLAVRAPLAAQTGVSKLHATEHSGPIFTLHVPPTCTRIVCIKRFKYRKTLRVQPLRTVNACFVLLVDLAQTLHVSGTSRNSLRSQQRGNMSEMTVNTAFGVFEIFPRGGRQYKINVKGAQDIVQTQMIVHKVCVELFACAPRQHSIRLNLLIIDAHAGVPLDIRPGGAAEQALQARCADVVVQYEEPEQNCHLLASVLDMSALLVGCGVDAAGLESFKVDVSITRLGKLIFRVSHREAGGAGEGVELEAGMEAKMRRACAQVLQDVSPLPRGCGQVLLEAL